MHFDAPLGTAFSRLSLSSALVPVKQQDKELWPCSFGMICDFFILPLFPSLTNENICLSLCFLNLKMSHWHNDKALDKNQLQGCIFVAILSAQQIRIQNHSVILIAVAIH